VAADSVEREILIEATPEVVWSVITEPAKIGQWFSDEAELEVRSGGDGTLTWRPGGRGGAQRELIVPIRVVDAEPFCHFSFRWNHPEGAGADENNSALVEFSLIAEGRGTRLRVLESAINAVTDGEDARSSYRTSHESGWERHLGELRDYATSSPDSVSR
jgi:uncharacterized protein YndB with AHSA1/START domain